MNTDEPTHRIRLNGTLWWTGQSWSSIKAFAKTYSPEDAAKVVKDRWSRGARIPCKQQQIPYTHSYAMPVVINAVVVTHEERVAQEARKIEGKARKKKAKEALMAKEAEQARAAS